MSKMKSMEQIYEDEIDNLIQQRDHARRLLKQHIRYHTADVDTLNEEIGDYAYRINQYQQLLKELRERKEQHASK